MRIGGDHGSTTRTSGTELGVSRGGRADRAPSAEGERGTKIQSGAYSLSLSGRAAELAKSAPVDPARLDSLRESYASPSWTVDATNLAHRLMEEA